MNSLSSQKMLERTANQNAAINSLYGCYERGPGSRIPIRSAAMGQIIDEILNRCPAAAHRHCQGRSEGPLSVLVRKHDCDI